MNLFKKKPKEKSVKELEKELDKVVKKELPPPPQVPKTELEKLEAAGKIVKTEEKDTGKDVVEDPEKKQPVEITPEHLVKLLDSNYTLTNQAYNGLVNRFDLLNNKLKNMEDVIHETWKQVHRVTKLIEEATKEEEPKKKK